ncbi:T9SS type A sorting domain-containing protein [Dyadobacter sp. CY327]|uniref:T9SS type A sorting domain-containing protein n=1 Tax=Dyadobacter sp. CY327 TaxID=2907301 RepID=UPI001F3472BB|nr:T9SS type A sorting domain-containing protein [Dyadobacter sp. CY327]MCE7073145.1 T9SS type A sorting domain-containing protein [Dyadobacter sp. CY327]
MYTQLQESYKPQKGVWIIQVLFLLFINISVSTAQRTQVAGPPGSGSFGSKITVLTNGNYVVTDPDWSDGAIPNVGAVYFYNGATHKLISVLTGSKANDHVGIFGVTALTNGNFVINSPFWSNGSASNAGAVTWANGTTGISGKVSASNSLVGSQAGDLIGGEHVYPLTNGNYVVRSTGWKNGSAAAAGAVTWGNGTTGITGVVSASNSLVGLKAGDKIGADNVVELKNGNYVVQSRHWDNGSVHDAGAVTLASGTTGLTGAVTVSNSLVGSSANDQVGIQVLALANGNYVVRSETWDNGPLGDAGAITWGNGVTGVTGEVNIANSLVGTEAYGYLGGITALTNGNYVVTSAYWDNGPVRDVGAVVWVDGTKGLTGIISASNSLVGSTTGDLVGGVVALSNGNYVVGSAAWQVAPEVRVGAATWVNGATGLTGTVNTSNSLVGAKHGDAVGTFITALTNGNYVVSSFGWSNGAASAAGAATWANGTTGMTGVVSASNSLVGSSQDDDLGYVFALTNGNYVVVSPNWDNGSVKNAGAATWCSGTSALTGEVSASNSLVGSTEDDRVGFDTRPLANGNYVVSSIYWKSVADNYIGAVTWGDGNTGITGPVSVSNSVVGSPAYNFGTVIIGWGSKHYFATAFQWNNGDNYNAGAFTPFTGLAASSGVAKLCNSILGTATNGGWTFLVTENNVYDYSLVGYSAGNFYVIVNSGSPADDHLADDHSEVTETIVGAPVTFANDCGEIGIIAPLSAGTGVSGAVSAKVYVAQSAPSAGQPYVRRYYDITPAANANTATGRVTLFYAQSDFDDFNNNRGSAPALPTGPADSDGVHNIRVTQNHGTSQYGFPDTYTGWTGDGPAVLLINPEDEDIVWNDTAKRWEVSFHVTGFSGFFVHSNVNETALPVHLVSFTAEKAEQNALLKWKTTDEVNASHFDIERSLDGKSYIAVGTVRAAGNGIEAHRYSFTDTTFASLASVVYYRLRAVDVDESFAFSRVVSLQADEKDLQNYIYPNPVSAGTTVTVQSGSQVSNIRVLDLKGRDTRIKVIQQTDTGFVLSPMPAGTYLVKFETNNGSETRKMVVE